MTRILLGLLMLATSTVGAADPPPPRGDAIVSSEARLELLFTRSAKIEGGLTEGPAVAPDGSIYFSDIPFGADKGMILRFDPKTKKTTVFSRRQRQVQRPDLRSPGATVGLRRGRRRRAARLALERQDARADHRGRQVQGQEVQRPERSLPRPQGPHLLLRSALPRRRAARAGASGRLPHRRRQGRGEVDARSRQAQRHRDQPGQKTLYVADHDNGTDKIDPTKPRRRTAR